MNKAICPDFKSPIIRCPHCGAEYVVGELYMPGDLIGKPDNIVKDALGKILYVDYMEDEDPVRDNHFQCDFCNKSFVVDTQLVCRVAEESAELDFTEQSVSLID